MVKAGPAEDVFDAPLLTALRRAEFRAHRLPD